MPQPENISNPKGQLRYNDGKTCMALPTLHLMYGCKQIREIIGEANYRFVLPYIERARQVRSRLTRTYFVTPRGKSWLKVNGVYVIQDDTFEYVNLRFARICVYEIDEMIGKAAVDSHGLTPGVLCRLMSPEGIQRASASWVPACGCGDSGSFADGERREPKYKAALAHTVSERYTDPSLTETLSSWNNPDIQKGG